MATDEKGVGRNAFRSPAARRLGGWLGIALLLAVSFRAAGLELSLVEAVKLPDSTAALALIAQGVDVNVLEADGTTALHWAVHHDQLPLVEALIRAGARADAVNRYGVTPLYLAAENGSAAAIERLIAAGADPNTALPEGETVLMTAARTGRVDAVKALLARGAALDAKEAWRGQTALMWAAVENNADVIRVLVDAGADIRATSGSGMWTPLLFAVRGGHVEATAALLDAGADVNERLPDGMSALVLALYNAHYELAAVLLDRGADPNAAAQGWTALHQIAWSRRPNRGFNLPGAVPTGDLDSLDLVRRLVARGADVNARITKEPRDGNRNMLDRLGGTPFLMAAKSADVPLMRVLLESGADPSLTTDDGTTAVMAAAGVGVWGPGENPGTHEEALAAVKLAYEAGGGDVNAANKDGETALHGAVYRGGAVPVIQFLADKGARLDEPNAKGWTPLFAADGVVYASSGIRRYPEAADLIRRLIHDRGDVPVNVEGASVGRRASEERAAAAAVEVTNWDGVYSDVQAERGRQIYQQTCAVCHRDDLSGDQMATPLVGEEFSSRWNGSTVHDMVETIRGSMPLNAPDSLGDQAYTDLISFLIKANGSPAGSRELSASAADLRQIRITSQPRSR